MIKLWPAITIYSLSLLKVSLYEISLHINLQCAPVSHEISDLTGLVYYFPEKEWQKGMGRYWVIWGKSLREAMWHDILQLFQWMVSLALFKDKWYTKQPNCCSFYSSLQEVWDLGKGRTGDLKVGCNSWTWIYVPSPSRTQCKALGKRSSHSKEANRAIWLYQSLYLSAFVHLWMLWAL